MLIGNVVFIILNLVFLSILILFIVNKGGGIESLEQSYAKQIALIVDGAQPGMKITIDMLDGAEAGAEWYEENYAGSVRYVDNVVYVKLSEESGYSYSFFNDVEISYDVYPEGQVVMVVGEK